MKSLDFYMNPIENHIAYRNVLMDIHERGVEEPLLFIADGLPRIEEEIKQLYPRAYFQLCTIHASRKLESHVRGYITGMRLIRFSRKCFSHAPEKKH